MKKVGRVVLLCALGFAACDSQAPLPLVIVYAPADQSAKFESWIAASGIPADIVFGDSAAIADMIIRKQDSPRADVVITSGIADIWRLADRGALRPIKGKVFDGVPGFLKDVDQQWAAIGYRRASIGVAGKAETAHIVDFRDLAAAGVQNQLCLSSSKLEDNQALVAWLIADMGMKPAERLVRNWIHNLARPPFASQAELFAALRTGECSYGIVFGFVPGTGVGRIDPATRIYNIDGVGIARHAQHPAAARALVDWMLEQANWPEMVPPGSRNVGDAGWNMEEVRPLVERAGYR